jgi:hypothetical protein
MWMWNSPAVTEQALRNQVIYTYIYNLMIKKAKNQRKIKDRMKTLY